MHTFTILMGILAVLAVGVVSPGPSFVYIAQTAVAQSRRAALAAALGMALGATLFCILALMGLSAVIQKVPLLYLALKVVGAFYLFYLAFKLWQRKNDAPGDTALALPVVQQKPLRHFLAALGIMLTNPKAAVQYGIMFAALMPAHPPAALPYLLPPAVFVLEGGWYVFVAYALSAARARHVYLGYKRHIDRICGTLMGLLGIKLLMGSAAQ